MINPSLFHLSFWLLSLVFFCSCCVSVLLEILMYLILSPAAVFVQKLSQHNKEEQSHQAFKQTKDSSDVSPQAFLDFSLKFVLKYINKTFKITNQNNTVIGNSSLKFFQPLRTKALSLKSFSYLGLLFGMVFQMMLNCQTM